MIDRDTTDLSCRHFRVNRLNTPHNHSPLPPPIFLSSLSNYANYSLEIIIVHIFLLRGIFLHSPDFYFTLLKSRERYLILFSPSSRFSWKRYQSPKRRYPLSQQISYLVNGEGGGGGILHRSKTNEVRYNAVRTSVTIKVWRHSSCKRSHEWRDNSSFSTQQIAV